MKKNIILPIVAAIILTGCGAASDTPAQTQSSTETSAKTVSQEATKEITVEEITSSDLVVPEDSSELELYVEEIEKLDNLALAKKAEEEGNLDEAYEYYGHAYWDGNAELRDKLDEIIGLNPDIEFASILKYIKMCPVAGDDVKSVHIRLADGTIVEDGGTISADALDGAVLVLNDENLTDHDYYVATIASIGAYHASEDPEPNWAYDTVLEKGREYVIEGTVDTIKEDTTYDNLCVTYIDYDVYTSGGYDQAVELNFTITR